MKTSLILLCIAPVIAMEYSAINYDEQLQYYLSLIDDIKKLPFDVHPSIAKNLLNILDDHYIKIQPVVIPCYNQGDYSVLINPDSKYKQDTIEIRSHYYLNGYIKNVHIVHPNRVKKNGYTAGPNRVGIFEWDNVIYDLEDNINPFRLNTKEAFEWLECIHPFERRWITSITNSREYNLCLWDISQNNNQWYVNRQYMCTHSKPIYICKGCSASSLDDTLDLSTHSIGALIEAFSCYEQVIFGPKDTYLYNTVKDRIDILDNNLYVVESIFINKLLEKLGEPKGVRILNTHIDCELEKEYILFYCMLFPPVSKTMKFLKHINQLSECTEHKDNWLKYDIVFLYRIPSKEVLLLKKGTDCPIIAFTALAQTTACYRRFFNIYNFNTSEKTYMPLFSHSDLPLYKSHTKYFDNFIRVSKKNEVDVITCIPKKNEWLFYFLLTAVAHCWLKTPKRTLVDAQKIFNSFSMLSNQQKLQMLWYISSADIKENVFKSLYVLKNKILSEKLTTLCNKLSKRSTLEKVEKNFIELNTFLIDRTMFPNKRLHKDFIRQHIFTLAILTGIVKGKLSLHDIVTDNNKGTA